VLQLPINNRKENIKVVAYIDKSIAISHLSSEGKQRRYTSVIPYIINIETARSTYRNGILEITFNRK
jgi:HSP20 family molecular chaperone IbpA